MRFGETRVETNRDQHLFEVQLYLNQLDPNAARVELYADGTNGGGPVRQEMERGLQLEGVPGGYTYRAQVSAARPVNDYTARVVPKYAGVAVPLESARILWQR